MKNNTDTIKRLLAQAMSSWPDDFTLSEAKSHLKLCLRKIEQVEARRNKRGSAEKTQAEKWWGNLAGNIQNPLNIQQTLDAIDGMMAEEQRKLDEIAARKKNRPAIQEDEPDSTLLD